MAAFNVPNTLFTGDSLDLSRFCLPVFIGGEFGALLEPEQSLLFSEPSLDSMRSGTVTFAKYGNDLLALTAGHVIGALEEARSRFRIQWQKDIGTTPEVAGAYLFTPRGDVHFHFNFIFTRLTVKWEDDDRPIDLAIARIDQQVLDGLQKLTIPVLQRAPGPVPIALAAGYPESGRSLEPSTPTSRRLQISLFQCWSEAQITDAGRVVLVGEIADAKGANNLSGISGGPVLWSTETDFGLLGIIEQGRDILPSDQSLIQEPCIWIQAQLVSTSLLDDWLKTVPTIVKEPSKTKGIYSQRRI